MSTEKDVAVDDSARERSLRQWVVTVCQELGLPVAGPDDDFFAAGGTSLTAIRLIGRVEAEFGEDALPPEDLFARATVREIAATLARAGRNDGR